MDLTTNWTGRSRLVLKFYSASNRKPILREQRPNSALFLINPSPHRAKTLARFRRGPSFRRGDGRRRFAVHGASKEKRRRATDAGRHRHRDQRVHKPNRPGYAEWHPVTADKLPDELKADWQDIVHRLTLVKDDEQGHVPATIDNLSDGDLNDLAMDIIDFRDRVDALNAVVN